MAGLNLPSLTIEILADGTAAIKEIEKTAEKVGMITQATEKLESEEQKYHQKSAQDWAKAEKKYENAAQAVEELAQEVTEMSSNTEKAAQTAERFGNDTEKAAKKANDSLKTVGERMEKIGKSLTQKASIPILAAITAAVKTAGDFSETLSKTEVVFGGMTDAVLDWSEKSIDAMGMAQSTALEMASTYGDMATGMGLAGSAAADMSMNMTQLAADIASFKNKSIGEVNTALTGVFTGETESLKQLGIIMTQTNLQAFALEQGITKSLSAMSQAEQVQLRYAYVMAQSSNAQGDFARTGDSLNNQTKKLTETIKQLANEFGGPLTEKVANVAGSLQQAAQWLAELDDGTKNTILNIGLMVAAAGPLLMVGGKLLTLVSTLKTQLALLAANPITLIVGGGIAAIAALIAVANTAAKGLDQTSKTYQRLKNAVEGGASGEITIDDSQVQDLADNPPTITINADGQNALDEAQRIADKLNGDEYDGMLTIDGDPDKAEAALTELEEAIEAAEAAMTIDADGNAVLEPGGELERLKAAIAGVEGIVAITADPVKKAELQTYLDELKAQLAAFNINVSYNEDPETQANIDAFAAKLATLPKNETYSATGEFKISDATPETIQQYAEALAAAATATGDYAEAVNNLNSIVDQETQRKIAEVNAGIAQEAQYQAGLLAAGLTTEEQASAAVQQAIQDGEAKIRLIEAEAEAQKELNETYANGIKADDAPTAAGALLGMFEGASLTEEQEAASGQRLLQASQEGSIGSEQSQLDAQIQLNALRKEAVADQEALAAATERYQTAMAAADTNEEAAIAGAQEKADRAGVMLDALQNYSGLITSGSFTPEEAISTVLSDFEGEMSAYEGLAEELRGILQGEDGEGLSYAETLGTMTDAEGMQAEAQQRMTAATEEAIAAREAALQEFQTTLAGIQEGFTASEAAGALALVEQAGVAVSEMDQQMILGGTQAIADLAQSLKDGETDVETALTTALSAAGTAGSTTGSKEGEDIGEDITSGVASGIRSGTSEAVAAAIESARAVTKAYKDELNIKSPSRVGRDEIGLQIPKGIGEGIMQGMPELIRAIRASTEGINPGTTGVGRLSLYTLPQSAKMEAPRELIDYEKLADAVSRRPISFRVGADELAQSTRTETARQQAIRIQQINAGYGGKGAIR